MLVLKLTDPNAAVTPNTGRATLYISDEQILSIKQADGNTQLLTFTDPVFFGNAQVDGNLLVTGTLTANISGNIIDIGSNILPDANGVYDIGSDTLRWRKLWVNDVDVTGNIVTLNVTAGDTVTANSFVGTISTASQPNITEVGTLLSLTVSGNTQLAELTVTGTSNLQGNVSVVNLAATGNITGNISGNFVSPGTNQQVMYNDNGFVNGDQGLTYDEATKRLTAYNLTVTGNTDLGSVANLTIEGGNTNWVLATDGEGNLSWIPGGESLSNGNASVSTYAANSNVVIGGNLVPESNVAQDLGAPTQAWRDLYLSGNTIFLGDAQLSAVGNSVVITNADGGELIVDGNGTVDSASIANGTSNVHVSLDGNVDFDIAGVAGVVTVSSTGLTAANRLVAPTVQGVTTLTLAAAAGNNSVVLAPTGTGTVNASSKRITNVATPTELNDAATKLYVDEVAQGLDIKQPVQLATAAALDSYTYDNGVDGVGATLTATANGELTVDGTVPAPGDRILVKDETGAAQAYQGIYVVTQLGDVSNPWILTRATDMDTAIEVSGAYTFVQAGVINQNSSWVCVTQPPITIGTTLLEIVQFSVAGQYTAGDGLTLTGAQFSVNVDNETTAIVGGNVVVKAGANLVTPNIGAATGNSLTLTGPGTVTAATANATTVNATTVNAAGTTTTLDLSVGNGAGITGNLSAGNISTLGLVQAANVVGTVGTLGAFQFTSNIVNAPGDMQITNTGTVGNIQVTSTRDFTLDAAEDVELLALEDIRLFAGSNVVVITDQDTLPKEFRFNIDGSFTVPRTLVANNITSNNALNGVTGNFSGNLVADNITSNNLVSVSTAEVTGNLLANAITSNSTVSAATVTATGNVSGNNIVSNNDVTTVSVTASGNISANNFSGNIVYGANNAYLSLRGPNDVRLASDSGSTELWAGTNVIIKTNLGVSDRDYVFSNTGVFSAPGEITAVGNITGANITSNGEVSTVTVSAAGNITGANITSNGALQAATLTTTGDATIGGNLAVNGNITYINVEELSVEDPIISVGTGANGAPLTTNDGKDRGVNLVHYDPAADAQKSAFVGYQNSTGKIIAAANVDITNEVVTVNNYGVFETGEVVATAANITGNVTAANFIGNLANGNSGVYIPISNGNIVVGVDGVGSIEFTANGVNALNLASLGNITAANNISGANVTANLITANVFNSLATPNSRLVYIDNNRTDTYNENGSAAQPFKTIASAVAWANANVSSSVPVSFVLSNGTYAETIDLNNTILSNITFVALGRVAINPASGNALQAVTGVSGILQMTFRNLEFGKPVVITGDGTAQQFNNVTWVDCSFVDAFTATTVNNMAFWSCSAFAAIKFTNVNYVLYNSGQMLTTLTLEATDSVTLPANGMAPGVVLMFNVIGNDVALVKGTGAPFIVWQPHNCRFGRTSGTYTVPATFNVTAYNSTLNGTWINDGTLSLRNSSTANPVGNLGATYSGIIGGTSVVGSLTTAAQPNITSVGNLTSLTVTGNLDSGNIATVGTANVGTLEVTGNAAVTGNITTGGILTDNYYYANGQPLDFELPAGANTELQFNSDGDFGASSNLTFNTDTNVLTVGGNVVANGVLTDNYYYANGAPLDFAQPAGANTQVQFNLDSDFGASANFTFDPVTSTLQVIGNITSGYIYGDQLESNVFTTTTANINGNLNGNFIVATELTSNIVNAVSVVVDANGGINTQGAPISLLGGNIDSAGNIGAISVNATTLTGELTGNVNGDVSANIVTANTVTAVDINGVLGANSNSQPNITSVGNLTSLTMAGNIQGVSTNDATPPQSLTIAGGDNTGGDLFSSANGGNLTLRGGDSGFNPGGAVTIRGGNGSLDGDVIIGDATTSSVKIGNVGITANIVDELIVGGTATVEGNITTNSFFVGNGFYLTDITTESISNGNYVVQVTSDGSAEFFDVDANTQLALISPLGANGLTISGANAVVLSADGTEFVFANTGTATLPNLSVTGDSLLGNLATANYFEGTLTANSNSQPNITSVGNLVSLNVDGISNLVGNVNTGNLEVTGNVQINGELNVDGNITYIDITNLRVSDPIIQLGTGPNGDPLTSNDGKDRGSLFVHYNTGAAEQQTAFVGWKNSTGNIILAGNVTNTDEIITVVDWGNVELGNVSAVGTATSNLVIANVANIAGNVVAGNITANATVQTVAANITGVATIANVQATTGRVGNYRFNGDTLTTANLAAGPTIITNVDGNAYDLRINGGYNLTLTSVNDIVANSNVGFTVNAPNGPVNINGDLLRLRSVADAQLTVDNGGANLVFDFSRQGNLTVPNNLFINNTANISNNVNIANTLSVSNNVVVTNDVRANTVTLGNATITVNTVMWNQTGVTGTTPTVIMSIPTANVSRVDFDVIGTSDIAGGRQSAKVVALVYNGNISYNEYETLVVGNQLGDYDVAINGSNLELSVTQAAADSGIYKITATVYY